MIFLLFCFPLLETLRSSIYRKFLPIAILIAMNLSVLELIPSRIGLILGVHVNQLSKVFIFITLIIVLIQLIPKVSIIRDLRIK